jgi:hypothetical protein
LQDKLNASHVDLKTPILAEIAAACAALIPRGIRARAAETHSAE